MQLIINGIEADIEKKPSWTLQNNIFATSKKFTRSTTVELPKTETNISILGDRFTAASVVSLAECSFRYTDLHYIELSGSLYVTDESKTTYSVVMVVRSANDDYLNQRMQDIYNGTNYQVTMHNVATNNNDPFCLRGYRNALPAPYQQGWALMPSFDIFEALSHTGKTFTFPNIGGGTLYYVMGEITAGGKANITIELGNMGVSSVSGANIHRREFANAYYYGDTLSTSQCGCFYFDADCDITFPSTFDENLFLIDAPTIDYISNINGYTGNFYGGYGIRWLLPLSWPGFTYIVGSPLAGKTVHLEANHDYTFVVMENLDVLTDLWTQKVMSGWNVNGGFGFSAGFLPPEFVSYGSRTLPMVYEGAKIEDPYFGNIVSLVPNFGNLKVSELIDIVTFVSGKFAKIDGSNVTFVGLEDFAVKKIQYAEQIKSFSFGYSDYAQVTRMMCDSEEYVENRLSVDYKIENDYLTKDKEVKAIICSEGNEYNGVLLLNDIDGDTSKIIAKKPSVGYGEAGSQLQKITPQDNVSVKRMCKSQRKVTIKTHTKELDGLTENHLIEWQGVIYAWMKINISGDTAKIEMQKI